MKYYQILFELCIMSRTRAVSGETGWAKWCLKEKGWFYSAFIAHRFPATTTCFWHQWHPRQFVKPSLTAYSLPKLEVQCAMWSSPTSSHCLLFTFRCRREVAYPSQGLWRCKTYRFRWSRKRHSPNRWQASISLSNTQVLRMYKRYAIDTLYKIEKRNKIRLYKTKRNQNGAFTIGKTWSLEDIKQIESMDVSMGVYIWTWRRNVDVCVSR